MDIGRRARRDVPTDPRHPRKPVPAELSRRPYVWRELGPSREGVSGGVLQWLACVEQPPANAGESAKRKPIGVVTVQMQPGHKADAPVLRPVIFMPVRNGGGGDRLFYEPGQQPKPLTVEEAREYEAALIQVSPRLPEIALSALKGSVRKLH